MKFKILLLFVVAFSIANAQNTTPPFYNDILKFKTADSLNLTDKQILFIGSSSFTKWTGVNDSFPGYNILNRAFGGSTLENLIYYRNDILYPYNPRQILIYCGENDFAASDTVTVPTVVNRFKTLYNIIRTKFKKVPVAFVSLKPSPSRLKLLPKFTEANNLINSFLSTQKNAKFISVYNQMLGADGQPNKELFVSDMLHMNAKGYAIWKKIIMPALKK
jgi:lysophospholipase L1-like esterase